MTIDTLLLLTAAYIGILCVVALIACDKISKKNRTIGSLSENLASENRLRCFFKSELEKIVGEGNWLEAAKHANIYTHDLSML